MTHKTYFLVLNFQTKKHINPIFLWSAKATFIFIIYYNFKLRQQLIKLQNIKFHINNTDKFNTLKSLKKKNNIYLVLNIEASIFHFSNMKLIKISMQQCKEYLYLTEYSKKKHNEQK